jgi:probable phosphoglycerate mutase
MPSAFPVLYLIRHAETGYNRDGRVQGHTDSNLSRARDRTGATDREAPRLREASEAAYASPSRRTMHTARLALPNVTVAPREGLREIRLGAWEGQKAEDLRERYPC